MPGQGKWGKASQPTLTGQDWNKCLVWLVCLGLLSSWASKWTLPVCPTLPGARGGAEQASGISCWAESHFPPMQKLRRQVTLLTCLPGFASPSPKTRRSWASKCPSTRTSWASSEQSRDGKSLKHITNANVYSNRINSFEVLYVYVQYLKGSIECIRTLQKQVAAVAGPSWSFLIRQCPITHPAISVFFAGSEFVTSLKLQPM